MTKKVLVPVMPTERFYDACVAAADLVAEQGGVITFLFTTVRPPPRVYDRAESQTVGEIDVSVEDVAPEADTLDAWEDEMAGALSAGRDLRH